MQTAIVMMNEPCTTMDVSPRPEPVPMSPRDDNADSEESDAPVAGCDRKEESSSDMSSKDESSSDNSPKGETSRDQHRRDESRRHHSSRVDSLSPVLFGATRKPWTLKNSNKKTPSKFPKTSTPREQLAQPTTPLQGAPNVTLVRYGAPRVTSGLRHRK